MNSIRYHITPDCTRHCGLEPARLPLVLTLKRMPFYSLYPDRQHAELRLIRDAHEKSRIRTPISRSLPHPCADQIPIAWYFRVILETLVAVSFLALC